MTTSLTSGAANGGEGGGEGGELGSLVDRCEVEASEGGRPPRGDPGEGETVNYDEGALVEVEVDGDEYRIDAGRAGTALCISRRESGTWDWQFVGEARFAAYVLRCKGLGRQVLDPLARALRGALENVE